MSANTSIEWTDHTMNPWWGCSRVSPGCANCYAETFAHRFGVQWGKGATRRPASEKVWVQPRIWNAAAKKSGKRARVFCASMADVFDDEAPYGARPRLFQLIRETPWLDWQLLTKRPENIADFLPRDWDNGYQNVWLGISVENQPMAEKRIPILLKIPAAVRFLSCEPLLGPVSFRWASWMSMPSRPDGSSNHLDGLRGIHWVIAGGESGNGARPMHPDWARHLRDQCQEAAIPFLFKQWGEWVPIETPAVRQIPMGYFEAREKGLIHSWDEKGFLSTNCSVKVGKKTAGRQLDGREWNGYPSDQKIPEIP